MTDALGTSIVVEDEGPMLVLVGAPGAGKTTVGKACARRLGVAFADSDHLVEKRAGKRVADIFVDEGEPAFRAWERDTVADALREQRGVLSLGGGAVLDPGTRRLLGSQRVVWLQVGVGDAARRVGLNAARPLLVGNVRGTLSALLAQRTPLYEEVSDAAVETDGRTVDAVTDDVLAAVAALGGPRPAGAP